MKLPRDLSGQELAKLLRTYGYQITRQIGSHLQLSSNYHGTEHHLTIPAHKTLKVGTLSAILSDVAEYLELDRETRITQTIWGLNRLSCLTCEVV